MKLELLAAFSEIMDNDDIIAFLKKATEDVERTGDLEELAPACMLVLTKIKINKDGVKQTMTDMSRAEEARIIIERMKGGN